jgi:hypothetical protein
MRSYIGPAQLVVGDTTCDIAVNLHEYLDLTDTPRARWRGVVVNASFRPPTEADVRVRIPGAGEAAAALHDRRLVGDGRPPFARV